MRKLRRGLTRFARVIKSLERGEFFSTISPPKTPQNPDEIDSAGDTLRVESDCQANKRNQTEVFPATTTLREP